MHGIVVALALEARSVDARRPRARERESGLGDGVTITGPGTRRAAAAAERLIAAGAKRLLNIGVAGGLIPSLRPGDLLVPDTIVDAEVAGALIPDAALRERVIAGLSGRIALCSGALVTSATALTAPASKAWLAARTHAVAVDMEAAAVARVALRAGRYAAANATRPRRRHAAPSDTGSAGWT